MIFESYDSRVNNEVIFMQDVFWCAKDTAQ